MQVQIRHDGNVQGDKNNWIETTVTGALERYTEITTVEVHLADEDGATKHSDGQIRASLEVRVAGFPPIAATSHGADVGIALETALDKIARVLDHKLGRVRDHHANA